MPGTSCRPAIHPEPDTALHLLPEQFSFDPATARPAKTRLPQILALLLLGGLATMMLSMGAAWMRLGGLGEELRQRILQSAGPAADRIEGLALAAAHARQTAEMMHFASIAAALLAFLLGLQYLAERRSRQMAEALQSQFGRLERLALQARKASVAKSDFLAMMSHDIRTPLNAVIGLTDLLAQTRLDDGQRRYLEAMGGAAENLMALINDILDLTRMEAGRLEAASEAYSPHGLCAEMEEITRVLAARANSSLAINIAADIPRALTGDRNRLRQVLLNLLGNAIKFTANGAITLSLRRETGPDGAPYLRYSVADTGQGVAEDVRGRLFQPFEQGKDARGVSSSSSGLGLAISARLVGIMGGKIEYQPAPGGGSVFSFSLPLAEADLGDLHALPAPESRPDLTGRRILVADDTPANLMVVECLLAGWGAEVVTAADGSEALAAAERSRFDLVYLDLQMPVMGGREAMLALREAGHNAMPVIALTAQSFPREREHALAAGFTDFVSKPVRAAGLAANLQKHLGPACAKAGKAGQAERPEQFEALDELASEIGAGAVMALARRFDADMEAALARLTEAQRVNAASDIASLAHKLTGQLAQFGLSEAASQARQIEAAGAASAAEVEKLRRMARDGASALHAHLGSLPEKRAA